jgi:uncharacterized protein (DUF302 family)
MDTLYHYITTFGIGYNLPCRVVVAQENMFFGHGQVTLPTHLL